MIIAIDGYEANTPLRLGIGRFAYEMIVHIYKLLLENQLKTDHQVRIYLPSKPLFDMPPQTAWWQYRLIKPARLWTFIGLPFALHRDKPAAQAVYSPTHYILRFSNIVRVASFMDLSFLKYPELFNKKDLCQLVAGTKYSARNCARLITISESSKRDIMREYHLTSDRIEVVYPGLTDMPIKTSRSRNIEDIAGKYKISGDYILSVGTIQPRKNYLRLIAAFDQFRKESPSASKTQLVIVGKKGWLYDEILAAPEKYNLAGYVKFLDFVPDEDLAVLYKHALCFVLPSLYEGFGLPVLEAMAQGCPIVVSRTSSLPEIAGEAAVYLDPESISSIAGGLSKAIRERDTGEGKRRIKIGLERSKLFNWEKAAKQTLEILEDAAGKTGFSAKGLP